MSGGGRWGCSWLGTWFAILQCPEHPHVWVPGKLRHSGVCPLSPPGWARSTDSRAPETGTCTGSSIDPAEKTEEPWPDGTWPWPGVGRVRSHLTCVVLRELWAGHSPTRIPLFVQQWCTKQRVAVRALQGDSLLGRLEDWKQASGWRASGFLLASLVEAGTLLHFRRANSGLYNVWV